MGPPALNRAPARSPPRRRPSPAPRPARPPSSGTPCPAGRPAVHTPPPPAGHLLDQPLDPAPPRLRIQLRVVRQRRVRTSLRDRVRDDRSAARGRNSSSWYATAGSRAVRPPPAGPPGGPSVAAWRARPRSAQPRRSAPGRRAVKSSSRCGFARNVLPHRQVHKRPLPVPSLVRIEVRPRDPRLHPGSDHARQDLLRPAPATPPRTCRHPTAASRLVQPNAAPPSPPARLPSLGSRRPLQHRPEAGQSVRPDVGPPLRCSGRRVGDPHLLPLVRTSRRARHRPTPPRDEFARADVSTCRSGAIRLSCGTTPATRPARPPRATASIAQRHDRRERPWSASGSGRDQHLLQAVGDHPLAPIGSGSATTMPTASSPPQPGRSRP
jgi:hypothetical protein